MNQVKECIICGLPSNTLGISFDKSGICCYCAFDKSNKYDIHNNEKFKQLFENRIEAIRGKYEYDALVGISGGKDGAYVLHQLIRKYDLKVLAFTFDNEFFEDTARNKIQELIKIYNVDHIFYKSKNLMNLYRGVLQTLGVPCYACGIGANLMGIITLLEKNIPLAIHGRSPFQMFRNINAETFEKDIFLSHTKANLQEYDPRQSMTNYKMMCSTIESIITLFPLQQDEKDGIVDEFISPLTHIHESFVPEAYAYFLTEPYDENLIRKTLQEEAGFEAPPSHGDCKIHNAANCLSYSHFGVTTDVFEAAVMVRRGVMDKHEFDSLARIRKQEALSPSYRVKKEMQLLYETVGLESKAIAGQ